MPPPRPPLPLTHENLGSGAVQRRWRVRTGLGPQGGMHSPQVLHSAHEPFPAVRRGSSHVRIRSQWGGEIGSGDLGSMAESEIPVLRGLPCPV